LNKPNDLGILIKVYIFNPYYILKSTWFGIDFKYETPRQKYYHLRDSLWWGVSVNGQTLTAVHINAAVFKSKIAGTNVFRNQNQTLRQDEEGKYYHDLQPTYENNYEYRQYVLPYDYDQQKINNYRPRRQYGGDAKQRVRYGKGKYVIRKENGCQYINVKGIKVWLKDIRGQYEKCA
jgi:hypothetical protein